MSDDILGFLSFVAFAVIMGWAFYRLDRM